MMTMRVFKTQEFLTVQAEVPCDTAIDCWLYTHAVSLDQLAAQSRHYEQPYLAWETVRQARNPYFILGSGFEGYLINLCPSPEAALDHLLVLGHKMLESNCRLYRYEYGFKHALMETIGGERSDDRAIGVWAALLGATLGRLRVNIQRSHDAWQFQSETYQLVKYLPTIHYAEHDFTIDQEYAILPGQNPYHPHARVNLNDLKPEDYDAGLVMWSIGRFGHPLIREFLQAELG